MGLGELREGSFEVQRPWDQAGQVGLAWLALALLSPVFWDPLEYGDVSSPVPDTSTQGQLLCPLCLV